MRYYWLAVVVAIVLAPDSRCAPQLPPLPGDGLHSDATILALAGEDVPRESKFGTLGYLDLPYLSVVKAGKTRPRAEVFEALGLDEKRMRDRRVEVAGKCFFLVWQVSPSYDLVCMAAEQKANETEDELLAPSQPVYGIRIVRRPAKSGR
jgi:hypothetical protein